MALQLFFLCPWSGAEGDKEQRKLKRAKTVKRENKEEGSCQVWAALLVGNVLFSNMKALFSKSFEPKLT